jgi:hypothetical protein
MANLRWSSDKFRYILKECIPKKKYSLTVFVTGEAVLFSTLEHGDGAVTA